MATLQKYPFKSFSIVCLLKKNREADLSLIFFVVLLYVCVWLIIVCTIPSLFLFGSSSEYNCCAHICSNEPKRQITSPNNPGGKSIKSIFSHEDTCSMASRLLPLKLKFTTNDNINNYHTSPKLESKADNVNKPVQEIPRSLLFWRS